MAETTSAPSLRELSEAAPFPITPQRMGIIVHTEPHRSADAHMGSAAMAAFVARLIFDFRAGRLIDPITLTESVAAARAEGVREGLERARQCCAQTESQSAKAEAPYDSGAGAAGYEMACFDLDTAIRALIPTPPTAPGGRTDG